MLLKNGDELNGYNVAVEYIKLCDDTKSEDTVKKIAKKILFLAIKVPSVVAIETLMEIPAMDQMHNQDA